MVKVVLMGRNVGIISIMPRYHIFVAVCEHGGFAVPWYMLKLILA